MNVAEKLPPKADPVLVRLEEIRVDPRAQPRDHLNMDVIAKYTEDMGLGSEFPPLVVFFDGSAHWLADGFHRHYAAQGLGLAEFPCEVLAGGIRDAILYSCGANATHGYPRTNADKRRAVTRLLEDAEWRGWSDREIARSCAVNHHLVAKLREELYPAPVVTGRTPSEPRSYITKHGTRSTMHTGRINEGRERPAREQPSWTQDDVTIEDVDARAREELRQDPSFQQDRANSWIWSAVKAVESQIDRLPEPEEAAQRFPSDLRHDFSKEKAEQIADWFSRFARAWRPQ